MAVIRGNTSRGVAIRGLHEALLHIESITLDGFARDKVRAHRLLLEKAYPRELTTTPSDVEQFLAEEDGEAIEDTV